MAPPGPGQGAVLPGLSYPLTFLPAKTCSPRQHNPPPSPPGRCPSRASASAQVTAARLPWPPNGFQMPCPRRDGAMQARPRWGELTHPHLSVGLQQAPPGHPRKPLAPAFPNMPRFTFLGRPHKTLGSQGRPAAQCLAPGAASLGLACSRRLDQMTQAFELSQHRLQVSHVPSHGPGLCMSSCPCLRIPLPPGLWSPQDIPQPCISPACGIWGSWE